MLGHPLFAFGGKRVFEKWMKDNWIKDKRTKKNFLTTLSAAGEERGVQRSADGVSLRQYVKPIV
jgi:hypothetical protein